MRTLLPNRDCILPKPYSLLNRHWETDYEDIIDNIRIHGKVDAVGSLGNLTGLAVGCSRPPCGRPRLAYQQQTEFERAQRERVLAKLKISDELWERVAERIRDPNDDARLKTRTAFFLQMQEMPKTILALSVYRSKLLKAERAKIISALESKDLLAVAGNHLRASLAS